jgi:putative transposase
VSPSRKRAAVTELRSKFGISERRACKAIDQPRSSQRFKAKPRSDEAPLVKRMLQLDRARPRFGYRRIGGLLVPEGWRAGLSRVFRLWQREGLKVPQKKRTKRRLGTSANGCHRRRAEGPNDVWCWDFIFDRTESGSQLKWLSVIDEYARGCLTLKVDRGITSSDVIDTLAELVAMRGVPKHIRSDNGPEFIANDLRAWLSLVGVSTLYIEPGSPWENGYAGSFHSRFRDECLALEVFDGLRDARAITAAWKDDYNHRRPHGSLGFQTPAGFAAACEASASAKASAPAAHAAVCLGQPQP